ncbi:MAG: hypothetical protein ACJ8ED_07660 [Xanthobacteraceae bacterium]
MAERITETRDEAIHRLAAKTAPQVVQVGGIECLKCRRCGVIGWRGSIVFEKDRNAAFCFECSGAVAVAA